MVNQEGYLEIRAGGIQRYRDTAGEATVDGLGPLARVVLRPFADPLLASSVDLMITQRW